VSNALRTCLDALRYGAASTIHVASGIGLALHLTRENPVVVGLVAAMRSGADSHAIVARELLSLAADGGDPAYAHQYDAAMFALLYALDEVAPSVALATVSAPWPDAILRASWTRGFATRILNNGRRSPVQHSEGRTNTMSTITSESSLSECGFSQRALDALSGLGLGPDAAVASLASIDVKTCGAKKAVLSELQRAAQAAGLSLQNAEGLVRKTREPKEPSEVSELPTTAKIVSLTLSDEGVVVTLDADGQRFEYTEGAEKAATLRLGGVGRIAFVPAG
jgi:hypothetical protein